MVRRQVQRKQDTKKVQDRVKTALSIFKNLHDTCGNPGMCQSCIEREAFESAVSKATKPANFKKRRYDPEVQPEVEGVATQTHCPDDEDSGRTASTSIPVSLKLHPPLLIGSLVLIFSNFPSAVALIVIILVMAWIRMMEGANSLHWIQACMFQRDPDLLDRTRRLSQYHLKEKIKQSLCGKRTVWMATLREEAVIIKQYSGKEMQELMQWESTTLRKLQHPNIVEQQLLFLSTDAHYLQFACCSARDVKQWTLSKPSGEEVEQVLLDVLVALAHIHGRDVVHCNVNPENVLVHLDNGAPRGRLCGFGMSVDRGSNRVPRQHEEVSFLTVAPEVWRSTARHQRPRPCALSDMYSFGGLCLSVLYPDVAEAWSRLGQHKWENGEPRCARQVKALLPAGDGWLPRELYFAGGSNMMLRLLREARGERPSAAQCIEEVRSVATARAAQLQAVLAEALRENRELEQRAADAEGKLDAARRQKESDIETTRRCAEQSAQRRLAVERGRRAVECELNRALAEDYEAEKRAREETERENASLRTAREVETRRLELQCSQEATARRELDQQLARERERLASTNRKVRAQEGELQKTKRELTHVEQSVAALEQEVEESKRKGSVPVPSYWHCASEASLWEGRGSARLVENPWVKESLQHWIRSSALHAKCGHDMQGDLRAARVTKVLRNENVPLWMKYLAHKKQLEHLKATGIPELQSRAVQPRLRDHKCDERLNELILFHGTTSDTAMAIARAGFNDKFTENALYGLGTYFADTSCKSSQYAAPDPKTKERVVIVARVVMGFPFQTTRTHTNEKKPPFRDGRKLYDSIFAEKGVAKGGSQQHNEFVIFDNVQAYPEYLVYFRS